MIQTLAVIRERVEAIDGSVDDLVAEVGRVPILAARGARPTITDRMHIVEGTVTPVAIEAAVHRALDARRTAVWTRGQKVLLFAFAALASAIGLLNYLGLGG